MLTQGPTPDPKCKLNISSFLTLPHLSDCLICTRNAMSILLLLQMVGDRIGGEAGRKGGCSFCCFFHLCFSPWFSRVLCPFILSD